MTTFPERVKETLIRHNMLAGGARVLAAFSGGADSLALLCALFALKGEGLLELAAAHLDHGLRGERSREDADWAEGFCRERDITFFRGYWPGHEHVKEGRSPEDAARKARRAFLEGALKEWKGSAIALGHHLDDQAETVLIHLLHGAGPRGLGGMAPVNGLYIRPLLEVSRREVTDYVGELGIEPRFDETNDDTAYLRNRLRRLVVPLLKEGNPGFAAAAGRAAELVREEDAYLDRLAAEALAGMSIAGATQADPGLADPPSEADRLAILYKLAGREAEAAETYRISLRGLTALDPVLARRALRLWLTARTGRLDADMAGIERVYRMALSGRTGSRAEVYGGISVVKEKGSLTLLYRREAGGEPGASAQEAARDAQEAARGAQAPKLEEAGAAERRRYEVPVMPGETVTIAGGKAAIRADWAEEASHSGFVKDASSGSQAAEVPAADAPSGSPAVEAPGGGKADESIVDSYACPWPAGGPWPTLRYRRPGDWLQMPYGRKKLKDKLIEKGVPRGIRDSLPLLAFGPQVLWIPGVAKAEGPYAPPAGEPGPDAAQDVKQIRFDCLYTGAAEPSAQNLINVDESRFSV
ncbi:MAG: tRNA lysidine(34) synthetase TilS [Clostridiales bacterium]|nr:tRNA lysidine(34) synthetase TilS [Clostridiales bacterium]